MGQFMFVNIEFITATKMTFPTLCTVICQ